MDRKGGGGGEDEQEEEGRGGGEAEKEEEGAAAAPEMLHWAQRGARPFPTAMQPWGSQPKCGLGTTQG